MGATVTVQSPAEAVASAKATNWNSEPVVSRVCGFTAEQAATVNTSPALMVVVTEPWVKTRVEEPSDDIVVFTVVAAAASMGNVNDKDSWMVHFRDTMRGGKFLSHFRMNCWLIVVVGLKKPDRPLTKPALAAGLTVA